MPRTWPRTQDEPPGSDGSTPDRSDQGQGYRYRRAGENVAAGRFSVERLMKGWMDSPPHKRNILGGFSQIGVGLRDR